MCSRARDPNVTWKDIDWLRSFARVPVLLKGVLNAAGAEGVERVLNILRTELVMAMGLTGRTTIDSIDRSVLRSPPETLL